MRKDSTSLLKKRLSPAIAVPVLVFFVLLGAAAIVAFNTVPYLWLHGELVINITFAASLLLGGQSIYLGGEDLKSKVLGVVAFVVSAVGLFVSGNRLVWSALSNFSVPLRSAPTFSP